MVLLFHDTTQAFFDPAVLSTSSFMVHRSILLKASLTPCPKEKQLYFVEGLVTNFKKKCATELLPFFDVVNFSKILTFRS